jgi:hypothetical protein
MTARVWVHKESLSSLFRNLNWKICSEIVILSGLLFNGDVIAAMNLLSELIPNIGREEELVLCYARTAMTGPARARIQRLTSSELDWQRVDEISSRHRLRPLLYKHLRAEKNRPAIPAAIWKQIENHVWWTVERNVAQASELARIIKLLRSENITTLPFKGPILGANIYGNLGLREFSSLDLLVRREDILRAKLLLVHNGFSSPSDEKSAQLAKNIESQLGGDFVSPDGKVPLELHCSLNGKSVKDRADADAVWKRAMWTDLAGQPVRTVAREDLFPCLCAQGAKNHWARLFWIVDIAEFVRAEYDVDWTALLNTARADGNWRVVALGLYLAYGLLDAVLPSEIVNQISAPKIRQLARAVGTWLFDDANRPPSGAIEETRFYWKTQERICDRVAFSKEVLKSKIGSLRKRSS